MSTWRYIPLEVRSGFWNMGLDEAILDMAIKKKSPKRNKDIPQIESTLLTSPNQYFHTKNGDVIRSLDEFISVLQILDNTTFNYHVNANKNDFATWVRDVFNENEMASLIQNIQSKQEMIDILEQQMKR